MSAVISVVIEKSKNENLKLPNVTDKIATCEKKGRFLDSLKFIRFGFESFSPLNNWGRNNDSK